MRVIDEVHLLPAVQTERDLGVYFTSNLKSSGQTSEVVASAVGGLFMMQRAFSKLTPATFLPAYCALVRPLIEYCSQAWAPILLGDIEQIEKVHKLAVRFVQGFKNRPYHVALQRLGLFSMARRRLRGMLIEVNKIINGRTRLKSLDLFQFRPQDRPMRGHPLT